MILRRPWLAGVLLAVSVALPAGGETHRETSAKVRPARGDDGDEGALARDAARLAHHWSAGGRVVRGAPRLLQRGDRWPLILPGFALDDSPSCASVAVLGTRNVSFLLGTGTDGEGRRVWPVSSNVGVAELTRCGPQKALLADAAVQMRSPRGVLEVLVAVTDRPVPPAAEILPAREAGPTQGVAWIGERPALASVARRATRFERRTRQDGARDLWRKSVVSDRSGTGAVRLLLEAGCHRVDVLADSARDGGVDVDAQLADLETGEVIAQDESESGQASLFACLGRATPVQLAYVGASRKAPALVVGASWALPESIPVPWGSLARARIAQTFEPRTLQALASGPVYTSLGVQGSTRLPAALEGGACYTVAAAAIRGSVAAFALGVQAGATRRENHARRGSDGVSLSFCAEASSPVVLEVQSSGRGLAWILGVWRTAPLAPFSTAPISTEPPVEEPDG